MTKDELTQYIHNVAKVSWFLGKDPEYYPGLTLADVERIFSEYLWAELDK